MFSKEVAEIISREMAKASEQKATHAADRAQVHANLAEMSANNARVSFKLIPYSSFFKKMPKDVLDRILSFQSKKERLNTARLISNKDIYEKVKELAPSWFGASDMDYQSFVTKMNALPKQLQYLFSSDNGCQMLKEKLITQEQVLAMPRFRGNRKYASSFAGHLTYLVTDESCQMLREKLITPEQIALINFALLDYLFTDNGCQMLRAGLITPAQAAAMPHPMYLYYLLTDNGCALLRDGLITPEQVAALPSDGEILKSFFSDNGCAMYREGFITRDHIAAITDYSLLRRLLSDNGCQMLREHLIIPEQVVDLGLGWSLRVNLLFSDKCLQVLREELTTIDELKEIYNDFYLEYLLSDNGSQMLRDGRITAEQVAEMPEDFYIEFCRLRDEGTITRKQALAMPCDELFQLLSGSQNAVSPS